MDRIISYKERRPVKVFKPFEYHDIIPYTIAILMLAGDLYVATHFRYLIFQ